MGTIEFENAAEIVGRNLDLLDLTKPVAEETIREAEKSLSILVPPLYRIFLAKFGFFRFAGTEIYGVSNKASPIHDTYDIGHTLDQREHGLPKHLILISFLDDGEYAALDTRFSYEPDQCPVIVCAPGIYELPNKPEKLADDFGSFFLDQVKEALARRGRI